MYPHASMLNLRHHSLVAWQRADDLFIRLHKLTIHSFPSFERFELGSQLRKAAYCVHAAWRLGYVDDLLLKELETDLNGAGAPLGGLIRSIHTPQSDGS